MTDENEIRPSEGAEGNALQKTDETATPEAQVEQTDQQDDAAAAKGESSEAREDGTAQEGAADDTTAKQDDAPKKGRAAQRINDLTRDKRNLQRQVARLNQKIGKMQAERPLDRNDFQDDATYQAAVVHRATQQAAVQGQFESTRDQAQAIEDARKEVWKDQVAEVKHDLPDFDQVFTQDLPITDLMGEFLTSTEVGPRMGYFLGKNRDVCARIAAMSDPQSQYYDQAGALRELARLEAQMTVQPVRRVSSAPKPVSTVGGKAAGVAQKPLSEVSYEEYVKRRRAQMAEANR